MYKVMLQFNRIDVVSEKNLQPPEFFFVWFILFDMSLWQIWWESGEGKEDTVDKLTSERTTSFYLPISQLWRTELLHSVVF